MAKRKKRAKVQPKKRAKPRRRRAAVRGKARKVSKLARVKATKPTVAGAKPKRTATKKAVRKNQSEARKSAGNRAKKKEDAEQANAYRSSLHTDLFAAASASSSRGARK